MTKERFSKIAIDTLNIGVVNTGNIDSANTVVGDNNHITLSEANKRLLTELADRLERLETDVNDDRESIAEWAASIRQELDNDKCNVSIIQSILNKIKTIPSVITDATITSIVEKVFSNM